MRNAKGHAVEELILVSHGPVEKPSRRGDRMEVREVGFGPNRIQARKGGSHADVRTVDQVKRVFVIDGRNAQSLAIDKDSAEENERDAGDKKNAGVLSRP